MSEARYHRGKPLFKNGQHTPYFLKSRLRKNTRMPINYVYWRAVFEATAWPIEERIGGMPSASVLRFLYNSGRTVSEAINYLKDCERRGTKPLI